MSKDRRRPWSSKEGKRHQPKEKKGPIEWGDSKEYQDTRWRKLSKHIRANHPECRLCDMIGRFTLADVVDHIIPIKQDGAKYHLQNLWPLCHSCHNRKTQKEKQGPIYMSYMTDTGRIPVLKSNGLPKLIKEY